MRLAVVRKFVFTLPEVTEEPHFHLTSFRVRGKIFVTVPPEDTHLHVFVEDVLREAALAAHPDFIEKLLWGKRVAGLRIALPTARPDVVENLVRAAWEGKRGKSALAKNAKGAKKK
jgi:YjbR